MVRFLLQVAGLALALSGGLWLLQGLGVLMWPAESFMLDQRQWAFYGAITLILGAALLRWAGKRR